MNAPREIPAAVTERQTTASNPDHSAWVSANAGSGKTHVLAQRVVRLLLTGVEPARILCITFTKAAAANMANKVFADLRAWTLLDDAALDAAMKTVGVKKPDAVLRARARQLFALALETPGGLKVQTIHAFCTQLLHLFPFEANVAARFEVLDEITENQMLGKLSLDVLLQAAEAPDTPLGRALAQAVLASADITFMDMVREAIRARDKLTRWVEQAGGVPQAMNQLSQALGIKPDETREAVEQEFFSLSLIEATEWPVLIEILESGSATDNNHVTALRTARSARGRDKIDNYLKVFCTTELKPRKNIITRKLADKHPDWLACLQSEQERVCKLIARERAIAARDRSVALFTIAYAVIARLRAEKDRRGLLDYDDLIDKTLDLLKDERAAWVHYKLDRGIHHVLIDEAQDTSPKQWQIVKSLVSEFFAGLGAHERQRTIFAVGDEKQSIFSFQGAAPREFAAMRAHFEQAHRRASLEFIAIEFKHSFRSGPDLLGAVDTVFARVEAFAGLTADAVAPVHEALPDKAPGLVEIWPLEQSDEIEKKEGWAAPFDAQTVTSGAAKLARRIAGAVAAWRRQGYRAKDVLILLRRRGAQFEAVIRALKQKNIPVAGADRLVLTEHIAVMDLMVLGDAILLPGDDLALATALKSPLFGLDDEALFQLAWNRKGSLHGALKTKRAELAAQFDAIRAAACIMTPFAFYAWLLGAEKGRRKLLARLGHEANDALDEFLNLALDYERTEAPSLQGFLAWLRAAKAEVKRDMEMDRDEVRVMTVHGAKGLEAPIVILADTTTPPQGWHPPRLLTMPPDRPVPGTADRLIWAGPKDHDTGPMAAAREAALGEARDEYRRLLYVAMTRAAERLVICGTQGKNRIPEGCWYQLIDDALRGESVSEPADDGGENVLRYRKRDIAPAEPQKSDLPAAIKPISAPTWLTSNVGSAGSDHRIVRPSNAADDNARAPFSAGRAAALLRGSLVHRLMQSLPDIPIEKRRKEASGYLARAGAKLAAGERDKLTEQVMRVLEHPSFHKLYGPGSRAEVPIVGRLQLPGRTVRVSGQIDRLAVTHDSVLIADFKSGQRIDPAPAGYIEQLALYRAVLQKLYPEKTVHAALLWTEVPDLMELSAGALDTALARVTSA